MNTAFRLYQINRVLAKYPRSQIPELHVKLNALATAWRNAQQLAATRPKPSPAAAAQPGAAKMTITTLFQVIDTRRNFNPVQPSAA